MRVGFKTPTAMPSAALIGRIAIIEMVPPVLRALDPFPVPVRHFERLRLRKPSEPYEVERPITL